MVGKLITSKIESVLAFMWQSQLRHRWDEEKKDCFANICDAEFRYWYEYLGNTPRLVITPLTDRCYITLTQVKMWPCNIHRQVFFHGLCYSLFTW